MRCILFIITIVGIAALFMGCESKPQGNFSMENRRVTIITEPAGAAVTQLRPLNQPSMKLGTTPVKDHTVTIISKITRMKNMPLGPTQELMKHVGNVVVRIEKDGYEPHYATLKTERGQTVAHEIKLQAKK